MASFANLPTLIPTQTTKTVNGSNVTLFTFYNGQIDELPNTILGRITSAPGIINNTLFEEGELIIDMKNSPENIDYFLDENGSLIVVGNTGDIDSYQIDSNGYLKWIN